MRELMVTLPSTVSWWWMKKRWDAVILWLVSGKTSNYGDVDIWLRKHFHQSILKIKGVTG